MITATMLYVFSLVIVCSENIHSRFEEEGKKFQLFGCVPVWWWLAERRPKCKSQSYNKIILYATHEQTGKEEEEEVEAKKTLCRRYTAMCLFIMLCDYFHITRPDTIFDSNFPRSLKSDGNVQKFMLKNVWLPYWFSAQSTQSLFNSYRHCRRVRG